MAIKMDNSAVEKLSRDARKQALNDVGPRVTKRCKEEAPERTGNLKRQTKWQEPTGEMREGRVAFDADYSSYVIVGTRHMDGNNFPARAIEAVSKGG